MAYQITKQIHFSYGHRLTKTETKCSRYHGHNASAEVVCGSDSLNSEDMVVNFDRISETLKRWVDENLDHRMILRRGDPMTELLRAKGEGYYEVESDPTAETIARVLFEKARSFELPVRRVTVWETPFSSASYRGV